MADTKSNLEELILLGRILWVLSFMLLTLSYVTVGLRLWVRWRITKSAGWDDFSMVATLVSSILPTEKAILKPDDKQD